MKKSYKIETADVHSLSHDGRGIATINEMTTFIDGALPHEKVTCCIYKKHRHYQEARVQDILNASDVRTTPPCQHFHLCGGCSLQHMNDQFQLSHKEQTLIHQLKLFGKVEAEEILPPLMGKTSGYRRRARLGVKYLKNKAQAIVGFREKNSRFLANLETCYVLDPKVGLRIKELSSLVTSLDQREHIPQIEVAISDHETALVFRHMLPLSAEDKIKLINFAQTYQFSIYLQPNPPEKISKIYPLQTSELLSYSLPEYQLEIFFHPTDFVQINAEINHQLIKQALTLLDPQPHEEVLDLFCGLGNFTLPLARFCKKVTGVEGSDEMVKRARENAEKNNISNVEFHSANLMEPNISWMQKKYDKILLDPPRTGAKEIISHIANLSAKKIVYVSCDPATLARDAGELSKLGYKIVKAGAVNMFPHTSHVEAIALFE